MVKVTQLWLPGQISHISPRWTLEFVLLTLRTSSSFFMEFPNTYANSHSATDSKRSCRFLGCYFCVALLPSAWHLLRIGPLHGHFCLVVCQNSCLVWVLLLALWIKTCFQSESHGVCRARLVCYSSLRYCNPPLPVYEYQKTVVAYIFPNSLVVSQQEVKLATSYAVTGDVEVSSLFYYYFFSYTIFNNLSHPI